ncbi:MAG: sigma-54-dependent Fis family transcriptional regulator, partial [candidate division Zixibacteria bacterium]|nr:sigma-54-dependent Fis family transcriptional regulator [candidate division Zixibacteria bacterium]
GVPLFEALSALYESEDVLLDNNLKSLHYLKNAYRQLMASGDRFYALLLCQRIAEIYQSASSVRLAGKFYLQAKKLAESLGNITLANSIAQKAGTLFNQPFDHTRILKLLHGISEILKNIGDYDSALENLVRFAVNESGAERGVLLLSADDHSELAVKLLVNCDPESIEDIKQFSRSVIKMVSREMTPLFIDNAREDSRTKGYKSILAHNILSVICLPIRIDERLAGVLYLDHRTIPALFEPEDITFIHSIANFISLLLSTIRDYRHQVETKKQLTDDFIKLGVTKKFITQNETMKSLFSRLPEIARSNISILLVGESGTGKEILGQMIHDLSLRSKGPLIKLNCAAIAESLIESELFGVAKNVATGVNEREGKLSAADGGTLFLDEIGDMPMDIQSKILRVLEYQSFEKVGSNRTIFTDIRFVYATNKDLKSLIKQGKFREDLYYRINAIIIHIPPLCERLDDIPLLLDHFLTVFSPHQNKRPIILSSALEALLAYSWPGNVRELKNLVEKYCLLYSGKEVDLTDLPSEILDNKNPKTEGKHLAEELEKAKTRDLLISNDWNQSEVSRIMGIPLSTLRRKIKKYRILKGL